MCHANSPGPPPNGGGIRPRPRRLSAAGVSVTLLWFAGAAAGGPQVTLPPAKAAAVPNLVRVPAPSAKWAALSEAHGLLAFAHDRTYPDAQVTLVKLDAKGNPAVYGTSWKLPRPDALAKAGNYALSVAFHPKLPLLYVWQDVGLNYTNPLPPQPPEYRLFDHLCIYDVAREKPELVVSLCRGDDWVFNSQGGAVAVDPAGQYLYVPNLREPKNPGSFHLGRFRLDADGLPVLDEKEAKLPPAARAKKLAELNAARGGMPAQITPAEYVYTFQFSPFGVGQGFLPLAKDTIITAGSSGVMTWRPDDKQAAVHVLPLRLPGHTLIARHPALPFVFATLADTASFYRVAHAEGNLSLIPLEVVLPGAKLQSAPVVMDKDRRLAIGGNHFVYFVPLDDRGEPRPEATKVPVLSPAARALVYSEKFDRLYVGVEVSK